MKTIIFKTLRHRLMWVILFIFSAGIFQGLSAQDISVTGVVNGDDGKSIPGVLIGVQGTSASSITDIDGKYTISAPTDGSLTYSSVGYVKQTIAIQGRTKIDVVLLTDVEQLGEVLVVGYGTRKKSHNTGAIAKVGGGDIAAMQTNRVDEALGGKLAGVLIQNQDGEPGADPKIQIRAASSISGNSNPLVVVDGYPIVGTLATVNPNDIASIEVLKDAASAAIYGSRGANGVILVTTKKGSAGDSNSPSISYNTFVSTSSRYSRDNINMTAGEYASEARANIANGTFNVSEVDPDILDYRLNAFANAPDVVAAEDWLFQNGVTTNHDLAVSGGSF